MTRSSSSSALGEELVGIFGLSLRIAPGEVSVRLKPCTSCAALTEVQNWRLLATYGLGASCALRSTRQLRPSALFSKLTASAKVTPLIRLAPPGATARS